jgi:putative membrane protein
MNQLGSVWVWTFDPQELAPVVVLAALYAHRYQSLRRRGRRTSPWRVTSFTAGLAMLAVALASPVDWIGENRLFAIHMVQHVLLGDIAPLLIVAGLDGPLLRPLLVLPVLGRLRGLVHPLVALPLWAIDLYAWHLPGPYQAALRNDTIHAFEHACFFTFGLLLWAALLEPLPGPRWFGPEIKLVYILAIRFLDTLLAFAFVWSHTVFFSYYAAIEPRLWGIGPLEDQNLAGVVMLGEGSVLTICLFGWLFLKWLREGELIDLLEDAGVPRERAKHAIRYGHADELLSRLPGIAKDGTSRSGIGRNPTHRGKLHRTTT